ncbi:MAG TPA: HD domain-containing protein [Candidatus Paceibacterota bacterium]|nr:HD domain-containing protein [Candidatus Paceibacterota bacterium]
MPFLDRLLSFLSLTHAAHRVERVARIPGETRRANMVEHSWQVAMAAWYVMDTQHLALDRERVLAYALCHDIVEAYAGDTYIYDEACRETKEERERAARERIAADHPEFSSLIETMAAYERRDDEESRFVYALDKMMDPLNIYMEDGLLWKEHGVTLAMATEYKEARVRTHGGVFELLYRPLWERLAARERELFPH